MISVRPVRILGVDPGSRVTGWGVIEAKGADVRFVDCGLIQAGSDDFTLRLKRIYEGLSAVIEDTAPTEFVIEKVFVHRNVTSALKLGQARGAALLAAATLELGVFEYSPNEVKQAITGRGHADKGQIQHMIRVLLNLGTPPASDAADALAVAVCHAHVSQTRRRMARAVAGEGS